MLKTLTELGFSKHEAEVYLLLYRDGPKKAKDIADELKICKRKVYRVLKRLQETKIIQVQTKKPTQFQVISFDNVLDRLIEECLGKVNFLEEEKPKILANWRSFTERTDLTSV
jgi:sugar-specific transcriptional regulator TrmB